jgi:hypothetical protein
MGRMWADRCLCKSAGELRPQLHIVGDGPVKNPYATAQERTHKRNSMCLAWQKKLLLCFKKPIFSCSPARRTGSAEAMSYALPYVGEADGTQSDLVPGNGWVQKRGTPRVGEKSRSTEDIPALRTKGTTSFPLERDG